MRSRSNVVSAAREALRRIVVVGGGPVGVAAAIALRKALPGCKVVVIGTTIDRAAFADRAVTGLPFSNVFHRKLGITEDMIVQRAAGSHRLVTRYIGWGGTGQHGMAPYGATVDPALKTAFAREWGGGRSDAAQVQPVGSLAEVLAGAGRFAVPDGNGGSPLDMVEYAMRWNGAAYHGLLVALARQLGVDHVSGEIGGIEANGEGGLRSVRLTGGGPIEADLFIDCSGPGAKLLSSIDGHEILDWSETLPTRRVIYAEPGQGILALEDRISLSSAGWLSEFAGRDGLQTSLGVSESIGDDVVRATLRAEPADIAICIPGRAEQAWRGNVVALGDAAARFDPLGNFNLDLAHRQIALLLDLLPGQSIDPLERAEFNRRAGLMADRVRDTLAAHYAAPAATAVFGQITRSETLDRALDQFARRGRLPFWEDAPFLGEELTALLVALGHPAGASPLARVADTAQDSAARAAFNAQSQTALANVPPYGEWLGQVMPQAG